MSIVDIRPVITDDLANPEPSIREIVFKYYAPHFSEEKAAELAREYIRQIEQKAEES